MTKRPRKTSPDKTHRWSIYRLRGTPAALIGAVNAPDEKGTIKAAIEEFHIEPQHQGRLIALAITTICKKAGLLGLFVWLAVAGGSSALAQPSLLEQLQKDGGPAPPPKSLMPPLRIQVEKAVAAFATGTKDPVVVITMAPHSVRMFGELTANNVGRRLELRIDGQLVSAPIIREPIKGGVVQISGPDLTLQDAAALAERLSKGEAKIEVELFDG